MHPAKSLKIWLPPWQPSMHNYNVYLVSYSWLTGRSRPCEASMLPALESRLLLGDGLRLRSLAGGICGAKSGLDGRTGAKLGALSSPGPAEPGRSGINRSSAPSATEPLRLFPPGGDILGSYNHATAGYGPLPVLCFEPPRPKAPRTGLPAFLRRKMYKPARPATTNPAPRPETIPAIEALLMGCAPISRSGSALVVWACDMPVMDVVPEV